jgi:hypothetical protein
VKTSSHSTPLTKDVQPQLVGWPGRRWLNPPLLYLTATVVSAIIWLFGPHFWALAGLSGLVIWPALAVMHFELSGATWVNWRNQLRSVLGGR